MRERESGRVREKEGQRLREGGGVERAREREAELKNESKDFISILFDEREFKRDKDKIR